MSLMYMLVSHFRKVFIENWKSCKKSLTVFSISVKNFSKIDCYGMF